MTFPTVRTVHNLDLPSWSDEHGLACDDPSLAVQSQAHEANINTIVKNFGVTGRLPQSLRLPEYGDFSGVDDYRSAIEAVRQAEADFLAIPSKIRAQFDNDPGAFAAFCSDRSNLPQLREWGLAPALPPVEPPSAATEK